MKFLIARFHTGRLLATPAALQAIQESGQRPSDFLFLHVSGDYGAVSDADKRANDQSILDGSRILSSYHTLNGTRLWVITEATDDKGERAATTIMLPEEY